MLEADYESVLSTADRMARRWLDDTPIRATSIPATASEIISAAGMPFPDTGLDGSDVVRELAAMAEPGLAATGSGGYFGLVTGGLLPAALGADWMVSAWDQNAVFAELYPGAIAVEAIAARWVLEALDLPRESAVGFTTGGQGANTAGLLAARHAVLAAAGHDVESSGLVGAPVVNVVVGADRHSTIDRAVRLLGLGTDHIIVIDTDADGRMDSDALGLALDQLDGPTIICAQAGNVNGGAFDPISEIASVVDLRKSKRNDLWLHIDGAFGLWVRASAGHCDLAAGAELADSWATDAHKWLNTPYDCGIVIVHDRTTLGRAIGYRAAYLPEPGDVPDPVDTVVESSRRARGIPVWAALRSLGRSGLANMIDRCCDRAADLADLLSEARAHGVEVRHTEINQLVVAFRDPSPEADDDAHTLRVLSALQSGGVCYPTGTNWHGRAAVRFSVSNWRTDVNDIHLSAEAIIAAHASTE